MEFRKPYFYYLFAWIVPNQNEKVLEEALAGFNSDSAKTPLRLFQVLEKSLSISQSFCHIKKRVLWMVL